MKSPSPRAPRAAPSDAATTAPATEAEWQLVLYVAGQTTKSLEALTNLRSVCEAHLAGQYRIEVVDLLVNPQLARDDQIVAIPTVIRKLPAPLKKVVGNLSDTMRTLVGLQLRPMSGKGPGPS